MCVCLKNVSSWQLIARMGILKLVTVSKAQCSLSEQELIVVITVLFLLHMEEATIIIVIVSATRAYAVSV